ncbi:MAG TPA: hypothetical protein VGG39_28630 [Polyangiaceae bacterium]|jgi:hypothetical protein
MRYAEEPAQNARGHISEVRTKVSGLSWLLTHIRGCKPARRRQLQDELLCDIAVHLARLERDVDELELHAQVAISGMRAADRRLTTCQIDLAAERFFATPQGEALHARCQQEQESADSKPTELAPPTASNVIDLAAVLSRNLRAAGKPVVARPKEK